MIRSTLLFADGVRMKHRSRKIGLVAVSWWGYAIAALGPLLAASERWYLGVPLYITFLPMVFIASILGGTWAGVVATVLSLVAGNLAFMEPYGRFAIVTMHQALGMGLFGVIGIGTSVIGARFRRKSEALRASEARLKMVHHMARIGAFERDLQTGVVTWSSDLEEIYGLAPGTFGQSEPAWLQMVHSEDRTRALGAVKRALQTFEPQEFEMRIVRLDGTTHWVVSRIQAIKDHLGKPQQLVGLEIDITDLKKAEEASRQSEERFRTMANAIPQLAWIARPDGYIFWFNHRCFEYTGATQKQLEGWAWTSYHDPKVLPSVLEQWRRCLAERETFDMETPLRGADGQFRNFLCRVIPLKDNDGRVLQWFGTHTDITDLKRTEEGLRQSEERFRTMANAIPQLAWMARPDGYIFWFNRRALEYFGATQEQLEGWAWKSVHDPQMLPMVLEKWRRSLASGEPVDTEDRMRRADGQFRTFLTRIVPLKDNEGRVWLWFGTSTDITERKQNEAEITALRDHLAADLAGMNRLQALSARFVRHGEFQILLDAIIDAAIALTGADKGHIQLFDSVSGEVQIKAQRGFDPAFFEYANYVRPGVLAAGIVLQTRQRVIVEDIATSPLYHDSPRARELVLQANMRAIVCTPLLTRANQLVGTLSVLFGIPYRPIDRDLRLLDLLARQAADSIERGRAEESLRAARQELAGVNAELEQKVEARTAKLREATSELEHMSYSMIHDMRAPLRAMRTFSQMLWSECEECHRPPASDYVNRITESAHRLDQLLTDALNYNQLVRENPLITNVDLGGLLRGMIESYPNLQFPKADIKLEFDGLMVLGNESLLTQCFGNLLDNAVKFVAPGVKPRVRIWAEDSDIDEQPATVIFIKDNGIGIEKNEQEKIFDLFQRLHAEREYPGTGIGLAIVRKSVERMNGRVSVESHPGKGTCFCVKLPLPPSDR
jgi:PAS domain S-box-containing protein